MLSVECKGEKDRPTVSYKIAIAIVSKLLEGVSVPSLGFRPACEASESFLRTQISGHLKNATKSFPFSEIRVLLTSTPNHEQFQAFPSRNKKANILQGFLVK